MADELFFEDWGKWRPPEGTLTVHPVVSGAARYGVRHHPNVPWMNSPAFSLTVPDIEGARAAVVRLPGVCQHPDMTGINRQISRRGNLTYFVPEKHWRAVLQALPTIKILTAMYAQHIE